MPGILADMAKKSEIKDHIPVGLSAIGGSRVIQHWDVPDDKNTAKAALRTGKVDVLTLAPIHLPDNKALNTQLQGLAWESVSKHPLSGLQAEPPAVSQAPADSSFPAHRVVGNVYYVGSKALASYLILIGNLDYPDIAADFGQTFAVLKSLPCDIFLGAHGEYYGMRAKYDRVKKADANPFIDPKGYQAYVAVLCS